MLEQFDVPAQFEMIVYAKDADGNVVKGTATLPVGIIPTKESIVETIKTFVAAVRDEGASLMTPQEFASEIVFEETKQRFACPVEPEFTCGPFE